MATATLLLRVLLSLCTLSIANAQLFGFGAKALPGGYAEGDDVYDTGIMHYTGQSFVLNMIMSEFSMGVRHPSAMPVTRGMPGVVMGPSENTEIEDGISVKYGWRAASSTLSVHTNSISRSAERTRA